MGKPGGRPIGYQGRMTEPPNLDKAGMCWLMWDGMADVLGEKVDMCKSQVRPWGLADQRLISLYIPQPGSEHSLLILQGELHLDLMPTSAPW